MQPHTYMPHIDLILQALRINRDRLNSRAKIAIDAKLLRILLQSAVSQLPFSAEFYETTYPDIAEAAAAGQIPDLHQHFVETGYFEGRMGAPAPVDEKYYISVYQDVAQAVEHGDMPSGADHYLRAGSAEGRVPNAQVKPEIDMWMSILRINTQADS